MFDLFDCLYPLKSLSREINRCILSEEEIATYLAMGESFDKAGAYAIQGEGRRFVRQVQGAMDTVIGLPVERLLREFPDLVQD